jgi:Tol biopolymer transport system component
MTDIIQRLSEALADRYAIERELGAGGMATVYLAHDVRHDRKVALKVLRPELSAILGGERFLHEIKTTANLQHPHILSLFDSGEADGTVFYVMPYVEGESLRERLSREKQLPVDEAVRIAREVADALQYAHEQGIVHRDIKPENILLHGGHAMVADFGIALAASRSDGGSRMTETGMSLGTPHYMSPEQAMGEREITPRADIYALGCVLYEMLTGEPPFTGPTAQAIIARVMTEEPRSLTLQRRTIPPHVEAAVHTALQKLPADRFATAAQFAAGLLSEGAGDRVAGRATAARRVPVTTMSRGLRAAPWVLAIAALGLFALERARPAPAPPPLARFQLRLTPPVAMTVLGQPFGMSRDGSQIVYVGDGPGGYQLYRRGLADLSSVLVTGSLGAHSPFFSPDGRYVAFVIGTRLVKVAVSGSAPLNITEVGTVFRGGSWNDSDTILYADERGLHLVAAAGGTSRAVAAPDPASRDTYRWPEWLPGGRTALFGIHDGTVDRPAAILLPAGEIRRFDLIGGNPHVVRGEYLLLTIIEAVSSGVTTGSLVAVAFDPHRLAVAGAPFAVADSVQVGVNSRVAKMAVSRDGAMVFGAGTLEPFTLTLVGRDGRAREAGAPPRFYNSVRLSPDGRRIAAQINSLGSDIWVFDLVSRTLTRLTFDGTTNRPMWMPDGRSIVYERGSVDAQDLARVAADGSTPAEALVGGPGDQTTGSVTPDGRTLIIRELPPNGRRRISVVHLDSAVREPRPIIAGNFDAFAPSLSPDGRWLAYVSDESGRNEVYVRPFPAPGGRWQISRDGGTEPLWTSGGREIVFRAGNAMLSAQVQAGATFTPGEVRQLFTTRSPLGINSHNYDVSRDGRTFAMAQPLDRDDQALVVMLNWFAQRAVAPR